jgi:hypothetical protein
LAAGGAGAFLRDPERPGVAEVQQARRRRSEATAISWRQRNHE